MCNKKTNKNGQNRPKLSDFYAKGAVVGKKSTPPPAVALVTNMSYALMVFFVVYSKFFLIFHTPPLNYSFCAHLHTLVPFSYLTITILLINSLKLLCC